MAQPRARAIRSWQGEHTPKRRCVASREAADKATLVRFVIGPDDRLVPDIAGTLPGRGLWLQARRQVVETAMRRNPFAKLARRPVHIAPDMADQVERLLERRCLDLIGLARRAGQAVQGRERVMERLARGTAGLVLIAADAGGDAERVRRAARAAPVAQVFSRDILGRCFGRDNAVFVVIGAGPLATRLAAEVGRLSGFRGAASGGPLPTPPPEPLGEP
ncbi:MAG: RNA-binding protein [Alphaproteobacteria bacterium]|nr:RNA-binding protein [Alphaproteobacteria bacterium]